MKEKERYRWAMEDSSRILTNEKELFNPDSAWKRIPGIKNLKNKNQYLAVKLATWREKTAIQMDLPRQWLLSDKSLIETAKKELVSLTRLESIGIKNRYLKKSQLKQISKLVQQHKENIEGVGKLKPKFNKNYKIHSDPNLLEKLSKIISVKAKELNIFPEVLAGKKDLLALSQKNSDSKLLTGWRNKAIGAELNSLLKNL